jgi:heme/copper-type cytochrome/quinol oxidase subunit 2
MYYLAATLHTLGVRLADTARTRTRTTSAERGSVTIEQVLWAVALIAIVGIVVLAIKSYVTTEAAKIK